ncbi:MAG: hypothetical protein IIZ39_10335, partial [Blautia sp.]|nr:hypothetical protein [Blautia sp.]
SLEDSPSSLEDSYSLLENEEGEDIFSLPEEDDEKDSPSLSEEWDEEDSLSSLDEWEEENILSSEEEEQEMLVRTEESISEFNLQPIETAEEEEDISLDSREIMEASWDGEITPPAATDELVASFLDAEALPVEAAEEETIFEGMLELAPIDALVGDDFRKIRVLTKLSISIPTADPTGTVVSIAMCFFRGKAPRGRSPMEISS